MKKIIKLGVLFLLVSSVNATVSSKEKQLAKVGVGDVVSDKKGSILKEDKNITGDKKTLCDKIVLAKKAKGKIEGSRSMTPAEKRRLAIGEAVIRGVKRVVGDGVLRGIVGVGILGTLVGGVLVGVKYRDGYFADVNYVDDDIPFHLVVENQEPEVPLYWAIGDGDSKVMEVPVKSGASVNYIDANDGMPLNLVVGNRDSKTVKVFVERDLVLSEKEIRRVIRKDDLTTFKKVVWKNMGITKDKMLRKACLYDSPKIALYLVKKGANVNQKDSFGRTLLYNVLEIGDVSLVKLLIEAGAGIDSKDKYGRTVIEYGLWMSTWSEIIAEEKENILKVVDYLKSVVKKRKKKIERVIYKDDLVAFKKVAWENMGMTKDEMLMETCRHGSLKVASYLIKEGADVEARDEYGGTPLCIAVRIQRSKVVELLIKNGANVNSRDRLGGTPLYDTLRIGDVNLVKLFIEAGADIDSKDKYGRTVIEYGLWMSTWSEIIAEEKENILKVVDYLKSVVEKRIRHAIHKDDLVALKKVAWENMGMTKDEMLRKVCTHSSLKVALYLIKEGANVEARDEYGRTLLHFAVMGQRPKVVELLMENGADVSSRDEWGNTPLYNALSMGDVNLAKLLIEAGADVGSKGNDGRTIIECGLWKSTLDYYSLEQKQNILKVVDYLKSVVKERRKEIERIIYGDDLVALKKVAWENMGMTKDEMLMKACKHGRLKVASYLVKEGANIDVKDEYGNTLLHTAVMVRRPKVVELLIKNGADIDGKNRYGRTPLYRTLKMGDMSLAKLLMDAGAGINSKDKYSRTVLEYGLWLNTLKSSLSEDKERRLKVINYIKSVVEERKEEIGSVIYKDDLVAFKKVAWRNMGMTKDKMLEQACIHSSLKVALYLIEEGANVEARSKSGNALLHVAVMMQRPKVVELLMENGADVNSRNKYGRIPLYNTLRIGDVGLAKLLVNAGADIGSKDNDGRTIIEYGFRVSTKSWVTAKKKENILKVVDYIKSVVKERGGVIQEKQSWKDRLSSWM